MSAKKYVLEIEAGKYTSRRETEAIRGVACPSCDGRGTVTHWGVGSADTYDAPCERCGGSGRLRADVTIVWSADE